MMESGIVALAAFVGVSLLVVVLVSLFNRQGGERTRERLRDAGLGGRPAQAWENLGRKLLAALPSLGNPLLPKQEAERKQLDVRLRRAGFNQPKAPLVLLGVKAVLMLLGPAVTLVALCLEVPFLISLVAGLAASTMGMVLPGLWLDWQVARRQKVLRRALPDALDMLVLCVEGGLSLNGALARIRGELQAVHPRLAAELSVVEREMMMGLSAGEALRKFGERADLEELRSLAAVLLQSERYGASMVKALRVYADTLRVERQQRSEEMAQKAAVKILFPTLLCIFPAIFVVVLGPAAYQIKAVFSNMK